LRRRRSKAGWKVATSGWLSSAQISGKTKSMGEIVSEACTRSGCNSRSAWVSSRLALGAGIV